MRAIRGFPLAHESSTFNSESADLFLSFSLFLFLPLESGPEIVPDGKTKDISRWTGFSR